MPEEVEKDVEWAKEVPDRLREDDSLALRTDRDGYVAFVYHSEGYTYEYVHRHFDEDEWRKGEVAKESLVGTAARFSQQSEIVPMPDLEEVDVTTDGPE